MQLSTNNNDNGLSSNERARYTRHLSLEGFGEEGQIRLKNSSVIFIGAGGLGSSAIMYIAAAGKGIAEIHLNSNKKKPNKFGYPVPGFIGTTRQLEGWESNWVDCFIRLRIEPQLSLLKNGSFSIDLINRIISKIKDHLSDHDPMNCLIHGDLWSGNVSTSKNEKGIIFDPSCWWADSEIDIAMTRLFGGFTDDFYSEYFKIIKEKKGSNKRTTIYNFYHILNHANMFGGHYINQVNDYINLILNM